jgi:LmbE family N-acetylglucosaminyl deacetylase
MKKKRETILVLGAHSDDFVIGAGGTIANYTKEGKRVIAVSFSYGELSHPWMKEKLVQKMRSDEAFVAAKMLKCKLIFFNLKEGKFKEGATLTRKTLGTIIKNEKPSKIFTHSNEDPHPDHRAVHQITLDLYKHLKKKPELYIYSVWNPVSFRTQHPALYVNVRKTFVKKLKALKKFDSQKLHVTYPLMLLLFRGIKEGFKIRTLFGEKFFRIK